MFADQLRDERKRLGLTQAEADALLDTCKGQVAAWESGRNTPHNLTQEGALARLRNRKTPRK
jgi:DNA-binding transcriptional regulator YiaG